MYVFCVVDFFYAKRNYFFAKDNYICTRKILKQQVLQNINIEIMANGRGRDAKRSGGSLCLKT